MKSNLLTRRRMVLDQQVQEPTLLVLALIGMGLIVALGVCVLAIAGLPAFGYIWWIFAAATAILAWLVWSIRRKPKTSLPSGRLRWFRRILGSARLLFIIVLTCWLGLILWSVFCAGGPDPLPKTDAALIRVVTWNLHCGQDNGPPWKQFNWPVRKDSLQAALDRVQPDILCVQEATPDQGRTPSHGLSGLSVSAMDLFGNQDCRYFRSRRTCCPSF
jgi:hypothetical protein